MLLTSTLDRRTRLAVAVTPVMLTRTVTALAQEESVLPLIDELLHRAWTELVEHFHVPTWQVRHRPETCKYCLNRLYLSLGLMRSQIVEGWG